MNKYIFLDIDGVLNSMDWFEQNKYIKGYTEINPDHVEKAIKILNGEWLICIDVQYVGAYVGFHLFPLMTVLLKYGRVHGVNGIVQI